MNALDGLDCLPHATGAPRLAAATMNLAKMKLKKTTPSPLFQFRRECDAHELGLVTYKSGRITRGAYVKPRMKKCFYKLQAQSRCAEEVHPRAVSLLSWCRDHVPTP